MYFLRWFIYITQWALTHYSHRLLNSFTSVGQAWLGSVLMWLIHSWLVSVWFIVKFVFFLPGANLKFAGIVVSHGFLFFSSLFERIKGGCVRNSTQWICKSEALRSKVVQTSQLDSCQLSFFNSNCDFAFFPLWL